MADLIPPTEAKPFQPKTPIAPKDKFAPGEPVEYLEADQATKNTFGTDVKIHPVTMLPIEQGRGALSEHQQVHNHLVTIEREHGLKAADAMRNKLGIKTGADLAEARAVVDAANAKIEKEKFDAAVNAKVKETLARPQGQRPIEVDAAANWSPFTAYTSGMIVRGTDGSDYQATMEAGNLDKDPTLVGNDKYWMRVAPNMTATEVDERMGRRPMPQE